jgi:G:T-mismatch repair DNA endonuclease (very short patch repair protein)
MADTLTPTARSERMSRVRGRDTKPEMKVRRLAHAMGYRWNRHFLYGFGHITAPFWGMFVMNCQGQMRKGKLE